MKRKYVPVRMRDEVLERVKNEAGRRGLSVSETVGILVTKSLDSGSESVSGIDPESVRKAVEAAFRESELGPLKAEIQALERTLYDAQGTKPTTVPEADFSWTKDQAAYLIYSVACIVKFFEEYNAAWNRNDQQRVITITRLVDEDGRREVQKYLPGGKIK